VSPAGPLARTAGGNYSDIIATTGGGVVRGFTPDSIRIRNGVGVFTKEQRERRVAREEWCGRAGYGRDRRHDGRQTYQRSVPSVPTGLGPSGVGLPDDVDTGSTGDRHTATEPEGDNDR